MLLSEIASLTGGKLVGDGKTEIGSVSTIENAKKGDLVFVLEESFLADALGSRASAFVLPENLSADGRPAVLAKNPRLAMSIVLKKFQPAPELVPGVHRLAEVHPSARLGKNVEVGPFAYIGPEVEIGDGSVIHPNVTLYKGVKLGKNCIVHAGARIGVDGYGFVPTASGLEKIPQIGGVVIGDNVEIYANVCIARGTIGDTKIGSGSKIDDLTHVAHNCEFGRNCAVTGLVGFAGSVILGDNVSVGGQAGFSGHLTVGNNAVIMARSGVTKDIPSDAIVSGFPAIDHKKDFEVQASLRRLPETLKKIKEK
ncbi:MAG TPA: UDP-3-O-(3-hydroxymyristoyl)glucosamine N-acyltransferase [Candidatus Omnitrophota bacterium]|nr:UDP-3-O-(3-hydroxymyristoyl)glucosamine N-acyltransferase [Candidatus Omnitrophota bacterium]